MSSYNIYSYLQVLSVYQIISKEEFYIKSAYDSVLKHFMDLSHPLFLCINIYMYVHIEREKMYICVHTHIERKTETEREA